MTRLAHIRAVLAVRLWLQYGQAYREGRAWWRSERRIRAAAGGRVGIAHLPDAEVHWPTLDGAPYAGQIWAIEAELTPKPLARTTGIMRAHADPHQRLRARPAPPASKPRYAQIVYLTAPAAVSIVTRSIGNAPRTAAGPDGRPGPAPRCASVSIWGWLKLTIAIWLFRQALKLTGWLLVAGGRDRGLAHHHRGRRRVRGGVAAGLAPGPAVARRRLVAADDRRLLHRARRCGCGPGPRSPWPR